VDADSHTHEDTHRVSDSDAFDFAKPELDTHAHADVDTHGVTDLHAFDFTKPELDADRHEDVDAHSHADRVTDLHGFDFTKPELDADGEPDLDVDRYAYGFADHVADGDLDADCLAELDTYNNAHVHPHDLAKPKLD
jgi:hypothetical protein